MNNHLCILERTFPAQPHSLGEIRADTKTALQQLGVSLKQIDLLVLAVNEACTNIMQHAYGPDTTGEIDFEIYVDQNELIFRLTDSATPIDPTKLRRSDTDDSRPGGLGMYFMYQLMDHIDFQPRQQQKGNVLVMKKQISQNP